MWNPPGPPARAEISPWIKQGMMGFLVEHLVANGVCAKQQKPTGPGSSCTEPENTIFQNCRWPLEEKKKKKKAGGAAHSLLRSNYKMSSFHRGRTADLTLKAHVADGSSQDCV